MKQGLFGGPHRPAYRWGRPAHPEPVRVELRWFVFNGGLVVLYVGFVVDDHDLL